ncbi:unnamed protein product, partial [Ectocarpus sp. 12 AP-2014]
GDPIGDDNPPLVLPNGRVYGSRAIRAVVTCPSTGQTFRFDQLRSVYII